jgi:cytochrome b561
MQTTPDAAGPGAPTRYDGIAMTLHWLVALAVLVNLGLGLYMVNLPRSDPTKLEIVPLHMSIGLTVLVISIVIIAWRLTHRVPPLPADMAAPLKLLARSAHLLFYVLILALPLAGWMMVSSSPRGGAVPFFGLFKWPPLGFLAGMALPDKKVWVGTFAETHETLAWIMIGLVVLHLGAVVYHQIVRHDGVLKRMLPGG